jgi:uncharacterized coiled-coil DUF342 family protein
MNKVTRRHATKSISKTGKKGTRLLYLFITSLTVLVLAIVYFILPDILGDRESVSPQIRQMRELTAKVGKLETESQEKREELLNLLKEYRKKTGEPLSELTALGLSDEEREILEEKIIKSKDFTFKSLLRDILDKDNEIAGIKREIDKYEALLPRPHIVIEGENHYQIAMDFLVNEKGIEREKAIYLVERTLLFESLIPDFKVWNFYSGDEYGTFVTQGNAPISPNERMRMNKKELTDAKDKAIADKDKLEEELKELESKRDKIISQTNELKSQINALKAEKQDLNNKIKDLFKKEEEMKRKLNSLFYVVDSKNNLIQKEIIKGGFLRRTKLIETSPEYFKESIDLRKKNTIEIFARQFELSELYEITLYPKFYKRGTDYKVEIIENKKKAVLTILTVEKFKTDRVVISVK